MLIARSLAAVAAAKASARRSGMERPIASCTRAQRQGCASSDRGVFRKAERSDATLQLSLSSPSRRARLMPTRGRYGHRRFPDEGLR
jgi:hypothetical protein